MIVSVLAIREVGRPPKLVKEKTQMVPPSVSVSFEMNHGMSSSNVALGSRKLDLTTCPSSDGQKVLRVSSLDSTSTSLPELLRNQVAVLPALL